MRILLLALAQLAVRLLFTDISHLVTLTRPLFNLSHPLTALTLFTDRRQVIELQSAHDKVFRIRSQ